MYFSKLLLKDFGKFHNRDINLKPGVNVVYGTRNAGKSTVADFEYATLYGIGTFPEMEDDDLAHHKPMDGHGFSGKAYVIKDGDEYLVERSFRKHNMTTTSFDESLRLPRNGSGVRYGASVSSTIFDSGIYATASFNFFGTGVP